MQVCPFWVKHESVFRKEGLKKIIGGAILNIQTGYVNTPVLYFFSPTWCLSWIQLSLTSAFWAERYPQYPPLSCAFILSNKTNVNSFGKSGCVQYWCSNKKKKNAYKVGIKGKLKSKPFLLNCMCSLNVQHNTQSGQTTVEYSPDKIPYLHG